MTLLLEQLTRRGEVAVAGREGRDRLWDLADRVYPDDPVVPAPDALRTRDELRLGALGIARSRGPECPVEPSDVGAAGEPVVVEGVRGRWQVDPAQLGQPFTGRVAVLSPFDRLIHDRKRMDELFGKVDATADRKAGVLRVDAVHQDVPFDAATGAAVRDEIADLARWLGPELTGDAGCAATT